MIDTIITMSNRQLKKNPKSLHGLIFGAVAKLDNAMFRFVRSTKSKDDMYQKLKVHGIEVYSKSLRNPKYQFRRVT